MQYGWGGLSMHDMRLAVDIWERIEKDTLNWKAARGVQRTYG